MSEVILNFENQGGDYIATREGDIPVPRVNEIVQLRDHMYRVREVLYDYGPETSRRGPEIWLTVSGPLANREVSDDE